MKRIKCPLRVVVAVLFSFILFSCATVQTGMQSVQLGMSRQEVIQKIGSDFQIVSMVETQDGPLEILRFNDMIAENGTFVTKGYYILHFLNGRLVESNYDDINMRPGRPGRPRL